MNITLTAGDRVVLRDRPWRLQKTTVFSESLLGLELQALDGDLPGSLSVLVPPEEVSLLPPEAVQFDPRLVDSFEAWARAHLLVNAALVRETGLLSGARFGRVSLEAFQLAPALRILAKPRPSILIADDVGLGKTIEAGIVMLELMARRRASRVLIVTPPGLLDQWQEELSEKFGLAFVVIPDSAGLSMVQTELPAGLVPWDALPRVITSVDFLKKQSVRARALRKRWDLIIVDEAHGLAESGTPRAPYRTQRTRLGLALRDAARGLILLTATPHNGYSHSFRSLLELVEPTMASLAGTPESLERRIETARVRRLKAQIKRRLPDGGEERAFPKRHVHGIRVEGLTAAEQDLLRKVSSYCSRTAREAEGSEEAELIGFAMQIVKKRALSSRAALRKTLEHRLAALRKEEEREEPPDRAELHDIQAELPMGEQSSERTARRILRSALPRDERRRRSEIKALAGINKLLKSLPLEDPKLEALLTELRRVFAEDPSEKAIVFTEYRDTLEEIEGRLALEAGLAGHWVVLHGGLSRSQRLKRQDIFEKPETRILLATDAASEGLNLQESCRRVIHFELPWNPNRLEQRNGRVDRYGQRREPEIRYLYYPDSAEESILDYLVGKIENMGRDKISAPDILGLISGDDISRGLLLLDPEHRDLEERRNSLIRMFDDRTAEFVRSVQPLLSAGSSSESDWSADSAEILDLLDTNLPLALDDTRLEEVVIRSLGSAAVRPDSARPGVFHIEVPWAYRGEGVKPVYSPATFRRSVAIQRKARDLEYITPMHPLVRSMVAQSRCTLLQSYAGARGIAARRLASRAVAADEPASAVFTFLVTLEGGGGLLEESVLAVRIDCEGKVHGDPLGNLALIAEAGPAGDVSARTIEGLFSGCFEAMRDIAFAEAEAWLRRRALSVAGRRHAQSEILLRDLSIDMADRLREIEEEENRARGLVEQTGQRTLFEDPEAGARGFDARRSAVVSYAEKRREEIAEFRVVEATQAPRPMGALFLVPRGEGA